MRINCAKPSASLRSVLFNRIESAACACRASTQIAGTFARRSSCQSQVDVGPVSKPTIAACGPRSRIICEIALGSDATLPSHVTAPFASSMQTEVSSNETSKPTYSLMAVLLFLVVEPLANRFKD
jgi:hypothetical protein